VNEGIRISSIVADIRSKLGELDPTSRARVERALFLGAQPESAGDQFIPDYCDLRASEASMGPTVSADGRLSWTVPVEISVGIPALAQAAQAAPPNPDPAQEFVRAASTAKAPAATTKAKATRTKSATKRRTRRTSKK
ncbi:MAG: hypothetical protein AAF707_08330, partial [Pseudomonadota bacterium]